MFEENSVTLYCNQNASSAIIVWLAWPFLLNRALDDNCSTFFSVIRQFRKDFAIFHKVYSINWPTSHLANSGLPKKELLFICLHFLETICEDLYKFISFVTPFRQLVTFPGAECTDWQTLKLLQDNDGNWPNIETWKIDCLLLRAHEIGWDELQPGQCPDLRIRQLLYSVLR